MKYNSSNQIGLYNNNIGSWVFMSQGDTNRELTISGSIRCSQDWDKFVVYRNGYNYDGGYFYVNSGGGYGMASDMRIKKNIETIPENKSIEFIKNLQPSSFCMKEQKQCCRKNPDGVEEEFTPSMCNCKEDGWIAQNVLESAEKADIPKGVVNNWHDYREQENKPEEERTAILGVSDRPILSHAVNVIKALLSRVEVLEAREAMLEAINEAQTTKINELQAVIIQHNELLNQIVARLPPV